MVIKMNELERRELIGNRKEFRIEKNDVHLRIVGNENRILVRCNSGFVDIVGNSSKIKVAQNAGSIQYTGNCGRISVGGPNTTVTYTGSGGRMKLIDAESALWKKKSPQRKTDIPPEPPHGHHKLFPEATVQINANASSIVINNTLIR